MSATDKDCLWIIKNSRNHYHVLGVDKEADNAEIKQKYKKMVHLFHPDKNKSSLAEEAFKVITNSYDVLINNKEREQYDNQKNKKKQYNYYYDCPNKTKDYSSQKFYHFPKDYSSFFHRDNQQRKTSSKFQNDKKKNTYSFKDTNKKNCKRSKFSYSNIFSHSCSRDSYSDDYYMKKQKESPLKTIFFLHLFFIIIFLFIILINKILYLSQRKNNYSFIQNKNYPHKKSTHYNGITFYINKDFEENYKTNFSKIDKKIEKSYLQYIHRKCVQNLNYINNLELRKVMYSNNKRKEYINAINEAISKVDQTSCYEYDELKLKIN